MKFVKVTLLLALVCGWAGVVRANEISLISGLYQNESYKSDGEDAGSRGKFDLGARYGQEMTDRYAWYGQGSLSNVSYDAPKGSKAPDNATGIAMGGGMRVMFKRADVEPFLFGGGKFQSVEQVSYDGTGWTQVKKSGLYYNAGVGLRLNLERGFFIDFEMTAFDTPLFATETSKVYSAAGNKVVETETSKKGLYVQSWGSFNDTAIGFGMKF